MCRLPFWTLCVALLAVGCGAGTPDPAWSQSPANPPKTPGSSTSTQPQALVPVPVGKITQHQGKIQAIHASWKGNSWYSLGVDGTLIHWSSTPVWTSTIITNVAGAQDFAVLDHDRLVVARQGRLWLWKAKSNSWKAWVKCPGVSKLAFYPPKLVCAGQDKSIRVVDVRRGWVVQSYASEPGVKQLAISSKGAEIIAVFADGSARWIETERGRVLQSWKKVGTQGEELGLVAGKWVWIRTGSKLRWLVRDKKDPAPAWLPDRGIQTLAYDERSDSWVVGMQSGKLWWKDGTSSSPKEFRIENEPIDHVLWSPRSGLMVGYRSGKIVHRTKQQLRILTQN
jgi:hypothetical protein